MGAFAYEAIDRSGKATKGLVEAADETAATKQLRSQGLAVLSMREGGESLANKDIRITIGAKIKSREITIFSRQFATMVGAGLTIMRGLMILEAQSENPHLRKVISELCADIESGRSLSEAMEKHPKVFDNLYISMVKAGEIGGVLEMVLNRIALQLEARDSLKRKIKSAMTYPTVVLVFALLAATGMIMKLVPIFTGIYTDLGEKLPAITQFLVNLSEILNSYPWVVPIAFFVPVWGFKRWKRTERGRRIWDRIALRLPMRIGKIVQKVALARFARTLSSLISSGVPVMQAVRVTGDSSGNSVIEDATDDIISSIEQGRSFSDPLKRHSIFPPMVVQMAAIGEETGKLDALLEKVAEFYEDEVDAAIKSLTSIVEPLMMMLVGAVVGFIIVALYLPMFMLFDKIK